MGMAFIYSNYVQQASLPAWIPNLVLRRTVLPTALYHTVFGDFYHTGVNVRKKRNRIVSVCDVFGGLSQAQKFSEYIAHLGM